RGVGGAGTPVGGGAAGVLPPVADGSAGGDPGVPAGPLPAAPDPVPDVPLPPVRLVTLSFAPLIFVTSSSLRAVGAVAPGGRSISIAESVISTVPVTIFPPLNVPWCLMTMVVLATFA